MYNALGRKIRVLVSEVVEAGYYYATWDGRNDAGEAVPSGVCFYTMEADGFRDVNKVLLLK